MTESPSNQLTDRERIARLERLVFWHNIGWAILLTLLVAYLIPPIGGMIGLVLYVSLIVGCVLVFISSVITLLDRFFPNTHPKE
ncbi:MAG: hypothetical protein JWN70_1943 [Planctomycetaceae bacterium]|nr:hypothetical protein [Planctomycetaceae bacterium]